MIAELLKLLSTNDKNIIFLLLSYSSTFFIILCLFISIKLNIKRLKKTISADEY